MLISRRQQAIYPAIALLFFSGLAFLCAVLLTAGGLGGYKPRFGPVETVFVLSIVIALVSYGFMLYQLIVKIYQYRWAKLLIWEKLNVIVLLAMTWPVYGILDAI